MHKKIGELNTHYGYKVGRVSIRNTKSRWGSCSKQGNLNFNYKILFLPPHIADYIIVHELCHIKEFNHSANFWNLVAELVPNHSAIRKELKQTAWKYH
ncbi:M48 family metallopeptidase [Candidatus Nomurabacteria bacterium]|nr:MAG: M48 family metallopeptidase [Candidatus Nomurabacteria bacterium]